MGEEGSSFNTEIIGGSLDEESFQLDLLGRLDSAELHELRQFFFTTKPPAATANTSKSKKFQRWGIQPKGREDYHREERGKNFAGYPLTRRQFVKAVAKVVGSSLYASNAVEWFNSLDTTNEDKIWWEELLDDLILKIGNRCSNYPTNPVGSKVHITNVRHCKRETIVKVVALDTPSTFCYAIISKYGRVGIYDGRLQLLDSYVIHLGGGAGDAPERPGGSSSGNGLDSKGRRKVCAWFTDAVHIPDANNLLLVSSDRSLHLYDCASLIHVPLCIISGLKNLPTCLAYAVRTRSNPSMLFIGDDAGSVTVLRFHQPKVSLFKKKHPDKLDRYYWVELEQQSDYVSVTMDEHVHNDSVRQVAYFPDNETVVSCSQDPSATLVIRHITARKTPYIFRLARGVRCFHMDRYLKILATGSSDYVVRLWNPVVTRQPLVSLFGHKSAVIDVVIVRHLKFLMSISKDGVLKVWDIDDQYCLQTLSIAFPSFSVLGKYIEFGNRAFYPGPRAGDTPTPGSREEDATALMSLGSGLSSRSQLRGAEVAQESEKSFVDKEAESWMRGQFLVACCNHLAQLCLQVTPRYQDNTGPPAPPPSREQRACIPSPWTRADERGRITPEQGDSRCSSLTFSSEGSILDPEPLPFGPSVPVRGSVEGLNVRRAEQEKIQEKMKPFVEQCAPHLALTLHPVEDIKFSRRELPMSTRMKERGLDLSEPENVIKARLPQEPLHSILGGSISDVSSKRSSQRGSDSVRTPSGAFLSPNTALQRK